ncbi:MAG: toll/interleukin-1 receptor domain-containing protein [Ktedonobacteraceae bacterium]|nr:toll/interleukin-1 receptor domain-containing protein [Ktedonobacteraceae bacterium]
MKFFISYRRKGWPFVHNLAEHFGKQINGSIFVDYTSIDEADFEHSILRHLRESDIVLVVVTELTFAPERINQDNDWVRREISLALAMKKTIVLILVDNQPLPQPANLPADIQDITRIQGIEFYPRYFEAAVKELATFVAKVTGSATLLKGGYSSLIRGQDALMRCDFASAKQEIEKALDTLQEDENPAEVAKAKYLLALVQLGGKRPFSQTLLAIRSVESLVNAALVLHRSYSYLITLAFFKLDFARNGFPSLKNEAIRLLQEARVVAPTSEDIKNINLLSKCQPYLVDDYSQLLTIEQS